MHTWEICERHGDYTIWRSMLQEWRLWAWTHNRSDGTTVEPTGTMVYPSLRAARDGLSVEQQHTENRSVG
jgi:hypothetical protein